MGTLVAARRLWARARHALRAAARLADPIGLVYGLAHILCAGNTQDWS